jgi:membrane protease YdiL (CAAX protease family)
LQALNTSPSPRFTRTLSFALFLTSLLWVFAAQTIAASASAGLSNWFDIVDERLLISSIIQFFLLTLGFAVLQSISGRPRKLGEVLGLPRRATAREEWTIGAALGWGAMVLAVLPMAIFGSLRVHFSTQLHSFELLFINLATLFMAAIAEEVAFRGFAFRRLIDATGPITATLTSAIIFGLVHLQNPDSTWIGVLITMLAGVLFSVAWFRTHGLWLPWGFHFAWNASMGLLFGLPVSGYTIFSSVVETRAVGRTWLTGGDYGPEAAFFTLFAVLASIVVIIFVTRDYAWNYTHPPIVPGGYPLDVAPPPAHAAMEQDAQQAAAGSLVQILPTTPNTMSVERQSVEHPPVESEPAQPQPVEPYEQSS